MQQPISPSSIGRDIAAAQDEDGVQGQQQQQRGHGHRDSAAGSHFSATAFDASPIEESPVGRNDVEDGRSMTSPGSNGHLDHTPTTAIGGAGNAAGATSQRKRKAGQGGRGVANLTPEQLAKKRANDREAQRNIRERTKAQIETLERTIDQLKSQQPYQELQRALRDKETVEAELAEVKRVLASVLALIQPHVPSTSLNSRTSSGDAPLSNVAASSSASLNSSLTHAATGVPRAGLHHEQFMSPIDVNVGQLAGASAAAATYSMPWQSQPNGSPGANAASQSQQAAPPPFAPRPRSPNGQPTLLGMASSIYRMTESEQEALTLLRLGEQPRGAADSLRTDDDLRSPSAGPSGGEGTDETSAPIWTRVSLNTKATCTLDNICITFLNDVAKRLTQGVEVSQAIGSPEPDWHFIANPDSITPSQVHLVGPMSRFFGQVLSNRMFPDLQKPPEKVGTAWLLYTSGYWQITRRKEDFERIPEWLRPSRVQQTIPHGPWIDAMFWPELRDTVLLSPQKYVFDDLFVPLTKTVSCNWPYGDEDLFQSETSGRIHISPRFLQHIKKLENWTMGPEFAQAYPSLKGKFNLRDGTA